MALIEGGLPQFHLPAVPFTWETLQIIFPYSLILAAIGLIESLLTLNLIDEMTDTRGKPNRECMAQGSANVVTGFFGGMGGCAMIGQSMINVNNGATQRLSGIAAALFFYSSADFLSKFTPADDTDEVVIDFAHARVMDHSAVEAIDSLAERYRKAGKRLHLRHLSPDCLELLTKAKDMVEIDVRSDPHYHIADNKLG